MQSLPTPKEKSLRELLGSSCDALNVPLINAASLNLKCESLSCFCIDLFDIFFPQLPPADDVKWFCIRRSFLSEMLE